MSRPVIGVGVLVWHGKKLLLGKRLSQNKLTQDSDDCWQFPGGHLEVPETVNECAYREVLEETGLQVAALRHLGFTNQTFIVGEKEYLTLLVSCEYSSGEVRVMEPDKCECWQWFDYQKLPQPLFEPISLYLAQMSACGQSDLHALHVASKIMSGTPSNEHK